MGASGFSDFYDRDDAEEWIADYELEAETCEHHGGPRSECPESDRDWYPQRAICYPTMYLAAAEARYRELHQAKPYHDGTFTRWSEDRSALFPFHYDDGVTIYLSRSDDTPDDDFLDQGLTSTSSSED